MMAAILNLLIFSDQEDRYLNKRAMMALDRSPELRREAKLSHESDGINGMRNAD